MGFVVRWEGAREEAETPEEEGEYTLIATFMGDGSYGSSSAATGVLVGPAPAAPPPPPEDPLFTTAELAILAAVIILIIIALIGILILKK